MDMIRLHRPLVIFDLETTGLDLQQDRIIELALFRLEPPVLDLKRGEVFHTLINPERALPEVVKVLTGISEAELAIAPLFAEVAPEISRWIKDADLGGYNAIAFDLPMLAAEFKRIGRKLPGPSDRVVVDALEIWRRMEPRTLRNAYRYFVGKPYPEMHRAWGDVQATIEVFLSQVEKYGLEGSVHEIVHRVRAPYLDSRRRFKQDGDDVVLCFGKYKGYALQQIVEEDPAYIEWMIDTLDEEARRVITQHRQKGKA